jgi:hypothetical protein
MGTFGNIVGAGLDKKLAPLIRAFGAFRAEIIFWKYFLIITLRYMRRRLVRRPGFVLQRLSRHDESGQDA